MHILHHLYLMMIMMNQELVYFVARILENLGLG